MGMKTSAKSAILIKGTLIFDGKSPELIKGSEVLVEGNPLENLGLVADPARNFVIIMKDGKIHKNTTDETKEETKWKTYHQK